MLLRITWKPEVVRSRQKSANPEFEAALLELALDMAPYGVVLGGGDKKNAQKLGVRFSNYSKRYGVKRGVSVIEVDKLIEAQRTEIKAHHDHAYIVLATKETREKKRKG